MIIFPRDAAQSRLWPIPTNLERIDLLMPNSAQSEAQQQHGVQGRFAIARHKSPMHAKPVRLSSQLHHIDGNNANSIAGFTVDQFTTNLAAFANSVIACLTFSSGLMAALCTIGEASNDGERPWHGLHTGNQCCAFGAHGKSSHFDMIKIRNNVPNCKRFFS